MKKKICNEATCLEKNPSWVLKESVKSFVLIEMHLLFTIADHCFNITDNFLK